MAHKRLNLATLRAAVSVICVITLLFVAFAHNISHVEAIASQSQSIAAVSPSSDAPDSEKKSASGTIEFCHACSALGMVTGTFTLDKPAPGIPELQRPHILLPHHPQSNNPPPVSLI